MMKLMLNCTNISKGGGIQVSLALIDQMLSLTYRCESIVVASDVVYEQLERRHHEGLEIVLLNHGFFSRIVRGRSYRELGSLETKFRPDFVVSVFGPVYWKPKAPHIVGLANAWCFDSSSIAWNSLGVISWIKMRAMATVKNFFIKKETTYLHTETYLAKRKIAETLGIDEQKIVVANNGVNHHFWKEKRSGDLTKLNLEEGQFRILLLSAFYPHKNIGILRDMIPLVPANTCFVVTLPDLAYAELFGDGNQQILNVGPVKSADCPALYASCDAVILPSLLETFSANYVEAMTMGKPILTSDLDFAHEVCGDAALYFNPTSPEAIAEAVNLVIENPELRRKLERRGLERLTSFDNPNNRLKTIIDFVVKNEDYDA